MFLFKHTAAVVTAPAIVVHRDGRGFSRGFDGSALKREKSTRIWATANKRGVQNSTARLHRACDSRHYAFLPQPIPLPRSAGALRSEFITVEEISGTARFATEFVLEDFKMLLLIIILLLLFGGGGGYYGHSRWGARGGLGVVGTVVVIALLLYFLGVLR
jgi:hypothetical protein